MDVSKYFETLFKKKYGTKPNSESAGGYDLGIVTGTVIQRANGKYSKESLVKAFHSNRCFEKTTVGKVCFPEKGGHASKPIIFMHLTKSGLKQL